MALSPDHFSPVATAYAAFRPTYPDELFAWLASQTPNHNLAWDCACGSGQAARDLAHHYQHVIATDISQAQIQSAPPQPGVEYRTAPGENSGLPDHCADLITVAQALHWLDLPRFYAEAARVARPGGVLAVWSYGVHTSGDPAMDARVGHLYRDTLGPYWPQERQHVENGYRDLPFPPNELETPRFRLTSHWTLPAYLGYLRSWSATGRFIAAHGHDPVNDLEQELHPLWPDPHQPRTISWPLTVRAAKLS